MRLGHLVSYLPRHPRRRQTQVIVEATTAGAKITRQGADCVELSQLPGDQQGSNSGYSCQRRPQRELLGLVARPRRAGVPNAEPGGGRASGAA
jgi:hypothetical protein